MPRKIIVKTILILAVITVLCLSAGYAIEKSGLLNFSLGEIAILSIVFSVIALITILIFFRGQTKEPESQTMHSLVAITLKFLLEIIFALIWFFVFKKTSIQYILIFFVIYLTLTLFSIGVMLKALKNKTL